MRALLAQLEPLPRDIAANAATVAATIRSRPDADIAAFPELFLGGYDLDAAASVAVPAGDAIFGAVCEAAAECRTAVLVGFAERGADGRLCNALACIDVDGTWAATYRKTHLFGREAEVFDPGGELQIVSLAGRRVGVLVCFDVEFPEPARALARAGAEVLVTVAANMDPWGPDHRLAARARALDNRLPHVYVNRTGAEGPLRFCGGSLAVGPAGDVIVELGSGPQTAVADVDLDLLHPAEVDYLHHVRTDLPVAVTRRGLPTSASKTTAGTNSR